MARDPDTNKLLYPARVRLMLLAALRAPVVIRQAETKISLRWSAGSRRVRRLNLRHALSLLEAVRLRG